MKNILILFGVKFVLVAGGVLLAMSLLSMEIDWVARVLVAGFLGLVAGLIRFGGGGAPESYSDRYGHRHITDVGDRSSHVALGGDIGGGGDGGGNGGGD